jgi:hypothetical protein
MVSALIHVHTWYRDTMEQYTYEPCTLNYVAKVLSCLGHIHAEWRTDCPPYAPCCGLYGSVCYT